MIFLDLTKAYDALDRSRCLGILEGYGVGPGARRLLRNYWRRLPKGKGYYRGIGLVEVMWKVVAEILPRRLTTAITYHDALHGFWAGRDTGTATLEAKLLQQLAAMREEVLYVIFLDLTKVYNALDRSRILEILEGCGVGQLEC